LLIQTDENAIIGAFTETPWKDSLNHYGSSACFLFQLYPELRTYWPSGQENNFMYMHSTEHCRTIIPSLKDMPQGLGFGGNTLTKPRLFIPETLENCSAGFLDKTFETGDILPFEALEKFEVKVLEFWAVGDDELIDIALKKQVEYRNRLNEAIQRVRTVHDKTAFVKDLETGFIINKLYMHREQARGRNEFEVDDLHGGYKISKE